MRFRRLLLVLCCATPGLSADPDAFVIAFPALAANAPRIADWQAEANFRHRVTGQLALPAEVAPSADPSGIMPLPGWYREGTPKPAGGRIGFAAWDFHGKGEPLVSSGLLDPVRLLNPARLELPGPQ